MSQEKELIIFLDKNKHNLNQEDYKHLLNYLEKDEKMKGSGLWKSLKKLSNKAIGKISRKEKKIIEKVIPYRNSYNRTSRKTLDKFGNSKIFEMAIVRTPVNKVLINILNTMSLGLFRKMMKVHGYDYMFHLSLIITLPSNIKIIIEKNAEINITKNFQLGELSEIMDIGTYNKNMISLNELMNKTKSFMGDKLFYDYDAFENNCQNFILSILEANKINQPEYTKFIYQDIDLLYKELETKAAYVSTFSKFSTRLGVLFNRLTGKGTATKATKSYPLNYGIDTERIIELMAFDDEKVHIVGTTALKNILYPGDFDLFETVKINDMGEFIETFKDKVNNIQATKNLYLGDIKIGEFPAFQVINKKTYFKDNKLIGYDYEESKETLKILKDVMSLDDETFEKALSMLYKNPDEMEFNKMKHFFKFHILRWNIDEINKGYKQIGKVKITLEDALKSNGLFKMDTVGFTRDKFMEFSIIYDLRDKQNKRINNYVVNISDSLEEDIKNYMLNQNYYKALKRYFSKLKFEFKRKDVKKEDLQDLVNFFNSEVGILNSVKNDIETLNYIINDEENYDLEKILNTVNSFIYRLSNVYTIEEYLKKEKKINKLLRDILQNQDLNKGQLDKIKDELNNIINIKALEYIKKNI
tara:strand:+ start:3 stop:1928 length:1926 start_codon:yes stop_codon:yes gene_type:complete